MACFQFDIANAVKPVCTFLVTEVRALIDLRERKETLVREMGDLKNIKTDTERAVLAAEEAHPPLKRTDQVNGWMEKVDTLDKQVDEYQTSFDHQMMATAGCLRCSCCSCWSSYKLSKSAGDLLERVHSLKRSRRDDISNNDLVSAGLPEAVVPVPTSTSLVVGGEETLSEIRRLISDDGVGVVGIYGMGGVGKTTLMKELNNELSTRTGTNDFGAVIWANVSKDLSIMKIQKNIGDRLRLFESDSSLSTDEEQQAMTLFNVLSKKRFLLMLDDVWAKLDLERIGIPLPNRQNKCKILFTARSEEVCIDMDAKRVKVPFLNENDSWRLFCAKVGAVVDIDSPTMKPLAQELVSRCGGLPLALITVGRAMANKRIPSEWSHATSLLKRSPHELRGMEKHVLSLLKFSFDGLENDTLRSCLLYCCLFPEDSEVSREALVYCWIGEGIFEDDGGDEYDSGNMDHLRGKGNYLIGSLQASCLLECGSGDNYNPDDFVRMHDSVRDMALWLTTRPGIRGDESNNDMRFLVHAGEQGLTQVPRVEGWREAKRISLMRTGIEELPDKLPHHCHNLSTLLISHNLNFKRVPEGFFQFVPNLRVLNLSNTRIEELPTSIGSLIELRYLNLTATPIQSLPKELGNLVRLGQLILGFTWELKSIPREAISGLSRLQVLNMVGSRYEWDRDAETAASSRELDDQLKVGDLEGLYRLSELGIHLTTSRSLDMVVRSDVLSRATRYLSLTRREVDGDDDRDDLWSGGADKLGAGLRWLVLMDDPSHPLVGELRFRSGQLSSLENLILYGFSRARIAVDSEMARHGGDDLFLPPFQRLRELFIENCHGFRDLTWVRQLPCLESIELEVCNEMEEFILEENQLEEERSGYVVDNHYHDDESDYYDRTSFPQVTRMKLSDLPSLKSIASGSRRPWLLFPSLSTLKLERCPQLRRLSLGPHSCKKLRAIRGEQEWWDRLEWGEHHGNSSDISSNIKSIFLPYFTPLLIRS